MATNNTNSVKKENKFQAINALRRKVEELVQKTYSLNQAVKALQGIAAEDELAALGLESFAVANVRNAWSDELKINDEEGRPQLALFMSEQVTVTVTDPETGEDKEVNAYERKVGKGKRAGVVSYKSLKIKTLQVPDKWTPSVIVEGLVQSKELELAKLEAEVSVMHKENVLKEGAYYKETVKTEDGMIVTFKKVEA